MKPHRRLDRLITLRAISPLLRLKEDRSQRVPILMYHSISETHGDHRHPYFHTTTSPALFAEQMKFLHEHHYAVITIGEAIRYLLGSSAGAHGQSTEAQRKPVVLTFDDGFRDFYVSAAPVLDLYGFRATVFLPTAFISEKGSLFYDKTECLTWNDVRELKKKGHHFGSHSVTHRQLSLLSTTEIEHEISYSKETIEDHLGESINSFSCPYAFPESQSKIIDFMKTILKHEGYGNAVTTRIGTASSRDDVFNLKRIPVNNFDDRALFLAKLEGAYDWLHTPQSYFKKMKDFCRSVSNRFGQHYNKVSL